MAKSPTVAPNVAKSRNSQPGRAPENNKLEQRRPICHHHSANQPHLGDVGYAIAPHQIIPSGGYQLIGRWKEMNILAKNIVALDYQRFLYVFLSMAVAVLLLPICIVFGQSSTVETPLFDKIKQEEKRYELEKKVLEEIYSDKKRTAKRSRDQELRDNAIINPNIVGLNRVQVEVYYEKKREIENRYKQEIKSIDDIFDKRIGELEEKNEREIASILRQAKQNELTGLPQIAGNWQEAEGINVAITQNEGSLRVECEYKHPESPNGLVRWTADGTISKTGFIQLDVLHTQKPDFYAVKQDRKGNLNRAGNVINGTATWTGGSADFVWSRKK
ncbi:MAG: hypothetical protein GY761_17870 [Hyphomicrobiales bacterium]|nr:hypothetical protein [Hyphomicrobiales bacterium]